jgi:hypothetical protein
MSSLSRATWWAARLLFQNSFPLPPLRLVRRDNRPRNHPNRKSNYLTSLGLVQPLIAFRLRAINSPVRLFIFAALR